MLWKNFISLIINDLRKFSTICGKVKHEIRIDTFTFVLLSHIHEITLSTNH